MLPHSGLAEQLLSMLGQRLMILHQILQLAHLGACTSRLSCVH